MLHRLRQLLNSLRDNLINRITNKMNRRMKNDKYIDISRI
nr:MAG TPA: Magnesium transport protein CorA transporter, magnesium binding, CORA [Crassvirales sp.]